MTEKTIRKTALAAAVGMLLAGSAIAATEGNTLRGPAITTTGSATVSIEQVGTQNSVSKDGSTTSDSNDASVSAGSGTITLTVQQVGGNTGATYNKVALNAKTSGATSIGVYQGRVDTSNTEVTGNTAKVIVGKDGAGADATTVLITQQSNGNTAEALLGNTTGTFTGTLNVVQTGGTGNTATVIVDGLTTAKTFKVGQNGASNTLALTAADVGGDVTLNFGGVTGWTASPTVGTASGSNNAKTYNAGGSFLGAATGVNLGSTAGFDLAVAGSDSNVQVDLTTAGTTSKVSGLSLVGSNDVALYGKDGNAIKLDTVTVGAGYNLAVYAAGGSAPGTIDLKNLSFGGNGTFSSAAGGSITMDGGTIASGGISVNQAGAAHALAITGTGGTASWTVTQSGPVASAANLTNTGSGSFTLNQTSVTDGEAHGVTLANSGSGTAWTVTQSGIGAKTLSMTNSTPGAIIALSQTGDATQSATGINFAAASGSTFTLVQK